MTVPVMLNGQGPFPFVVDTGSNRTVIADTVAQQLALPARGVIRVASATGVVSTPSALIAHLQVGRHQVSNIRAPVLVHSNLGAAGMLGIDAVADQTIIMDFRAWSMRIQPSSRADDDANAVVVRGRSHYGQLILVDASAEGAPLYVIIDTGGEVTIGNTTLQRALQRRAQIFQPVGIDSVTGGHIDADQQTIRRVLLGHVEMRGLPIAYADLHAFKQFGLQSKPAMLLGMSTLRLFERVWVDFKSREVRFLFSDTASADNGRLPDRGIVDARG